MFKSMSFLLLVTVITAFSTNAFAAAQLVCDSEDGSALRAIVDNDNNVFQIETRVRSGRNESGAFESLPYAHATGFETEMVNGKEIVKSIIITNDRKIVVAVAAGSYVDEVGGSYEVTSCEVSY